jgi:hypothetical protein
MSETTFEKMQKHCNEIYNAINDLEYEKIKLESVLKFEQMTMLMSVSNDFEELLEKYIAKCEELKNSKEKLTPQKQFFLERSGDKISSFKSMHKSLLTDKISLSGFDTQYLKELKQAYNDISDNTSLSLEEVLNMNKVVVSESDNESNEGQIFEMSDLTVNQ